MDPYHLEYCREAFIQPSRCLDGPEWGNDGYFWCSWNIVSIAYSACYELCRVLYTLHWTISCVQTRKMVHYEQDIMCWWEIQKFRHLSLHYSNVLSWGMPLKILNHIRHCYTILDGQNHQLPCLSAWQISFLHKPHEKSCCLPFIDSAPEYNRYWDQSHHFSQNSNTTKSNGEVPLAKLPSRCNRIDILP